jgi:glutaredoxin
MNSIVIFTLNGCGHCQSLKRRLQEISIDFTEIEIDANEEIWKQVVRQTGEDVIPTIFIKKENDENGPVYVPGRDFQSEDEIVEIIKTYMC